MNEELANINETIAKLRIDLMATNQVLLAMSSTLTPDQQRQTLQALAELSVMQEQTVEQAQRPEAITLLQASIQRMYSALDGVAKMRAAKTGL